MSALGKIVKSVVKEMPDDVLKKGVKAIKEVAEEELGTSIPKITKQTIKQEAEEGIVKTTQKQAQQAAETMFTHGAEALQKQKQDVKGLIELATEFGQKMDSGEMTATQAMKAFDKKRELGQIRAETKASFSGAGQTEKLASEDELTVRLNQLVPKIEEYKNKNSFRNYLNVLSHINDSKELEALGLISKNQQSKGTAAKFFENSMTFFKNALLIAHPENRLLDGGANFFTRGVSLLDLKVAETLSGTRAKISKLFPQGTVRELLGSQGYYSGEAAASLNGTLVAIKDTLVETAENVRRFAKNKSTEGWKETPIGRHARKINAEYQWQRFHEFEDAALPNDIKGTIDYLATKSGFALSKGVDVFGGGAFRAGDVAQNALAQAARRAEEIGKSGDRNFIDEFSRFLIAADNGEKLPASQIKKYQSLFGNKGMDDMLTSIAEESSESAARDTYRKEASTFVGRALAKADKAITKVPVVGRIYDAFFPLARTGYKILDVAFSENPILQAREAAKALKIARKELSETGTTNLRNLDKAAARFLTGSMAYTGASILVYNNFLTGKLPTGAEGKLWKEKGYKAYSINLPGMSIPYRRLGKTADVLGTIADVINDWKKFNDEYEDVSTTYGPVEYGLDLVGMFMADPLWSVSFGDMISDFQLGKVTKKKLEGYASLFPQMYDNLKQSLGFEPSDYLREMVINTGKKISDYKGSGKFRPRLDIFGEKVKNNYEVKEDKLADEMFFQSAFPSEPGYTATVDGVEIELTGDERYAWREMMSHIHDKETDMHYSTRDKLKSVIYDIDTTKKGSYYSALDNLELDDMGLRKEYKRGTLLGTYNECKNAALETLLEYKDKSVANGREKEYAKYANDMWRRAREVKLNKMEMPVINKNLPPSFKKPTLQ